jgi:hypothetical protein
LFYDSSKSDERDAQIEANAIAKMQSYLQMGHTPQDIHNYAQSLDQANEKLGNPTHLADIYTSDSSDTGISDVNRTKDQTLQQNADTNKRKAEIAANVANERAGHDKAMEILGDKNATTRWFQAQSGRQGEVDRGNYLQFMEQWKKNGGSSNAPTKDLSGQSMFDSPWGKTYDEAVKARDKATATLAMWRAATGPDPAYPTDATKTIRLHVGMPDPPDLVDSIVRYDAQLDRMNNTNPPQGK